MEIVNKLRLSIELLSKKDFLKYLVVVFSIVVFLTVITIFLHHKKINVLKIRIEDINDVREETVKRILKRMNTVSRQREQVNQILDKQRDFKIAYYLSDLLEKQGLSEKKTSESPSVVELGNDYSEVLLNIRLIDMNMKQLCEFLEKIEKNERVYAKDLEITQSNKNLKTIDVGVTIATLQPKLKVGL